MTTSMKYLLVCIPIVILAGVVIWFYVGMKNVPELGSMQNNFFFSTTIGQENVVVTTTRSGEETIGLLQKIAPSASSLQGVWRASGNVGEGLSWYLKYTFKNGTYTMEGYPPILEEGTYTIIKKEKVDATSTMITLQLSVKGEENKEFKIKLLDNGKAIIGNETYTKQ